MRGGVKWIKNQLYWCEFGSNVSHTFAIPTLVLRNALKNERILVCFSVFEMIDGADIYHKRTSNTWFTPTLLYRILQRLSHLTTDRTSGRAGLLWPRQPLSICFINNKFLSFAHILATFPLRDLQLNAHLTPSLHSLIRDVFCLSLLPLTFTYLNFPSTTFHLFSSLDVATVVKVLISTLAVNFFSIFLIRKVSVPILIVQDTRVISDGTILACILLSLYPHHAFLPRTKNLNYFTLIFLTISYLWIVKKNLSEDRNLTQVAGMRDL